MAELDDRCKILCVKELKMLASKKVSDVPVKSPSDSSSDSDTEVRYCRMEFLLFYF